MTDDIFSRTVLAGYSPEVLGKAKVLVAGLGALGQNVVQTLALSGIGNLALVDFDYFEPHNATRSPYYPTLAEQAVLGLAKAPVVAHRAGLSTTMADASVRYSTTTIQQLGNGVIAWADVVVSAVDSITARAWLAEQCRVHGKPMVEAGFSGPDFTLALFSGATGEPCYRCANPERASSASCTLYAQQAERSGIVPAIQTTAAVAGGLQAEAVIDLLHGYRVDLGMRLYGNIRSLQFDSAKLQLNPQCPGEHERFPELARIDVDGTIADLAAALDHLGVTQFAFTEPVVANPACRDCHTTCAITLLESTWLRGPTCSACGGAWPRADHVGRPTYTKLIPVAAVDGLADVELAQVGTAAGSTVVAVTEDGFVGLVYVGDADAAFERLTRASA